MSEIDPKTLARAEEQARVIVSKIKGEYTKRVITRWNEIESRYGIDLDDYTGEKWSAEAKSAVIQSSFFLDLVLKNYIAGTKNRLLKTFTLDTSKKRFKLSPPEECYRFCRNPKWKLYEEQDPVFRAVVNDFFNAPNPPRTLWQNGKTGSGKTEILNALLEYFFDHQLHLNKALPIPLPYPVVWYTVANAVDQTIEKARNAGLGEFIDKKLLHILPYTALTSSLVEGTLWTKNELVDPFTGEVSYEINWCPMALHRLVVFDEAHALQNPESGRTKAVLAMDKFHREYNWPIQYMFFSATLAEKMRDTYCFTALSNITFQGNLITKDNFVVQFANILSPSGIHLPNKEAMRKFRMVVSDRLYEIPHKAWPFKLRSAVKLYKFLSDEQIQSYNRAEEEFLDKISQLGREIPSERALRAIAVTQFAKKCEPIRAEQMVAEMYENVVKNKRTSLMATRFVGTIIKSVFLLMDKYNVPREEISIVWGGRPDVKPERILSSQEILDIAAQSLASGEALPSKVKRLIEKNLSWAEDRLLFGDTSEEEHDERYERLRSLGLVGVQTMAIRQAERRKFMTGQSKFFLYTISAGGTGLSMEHADERTSPRDLWLTPPYSGKDFIQGSTRHHRRNSISDSGLFVCLMDGTVESEHVAPILDQKLQSLGEGSTVKTDLTMLLANLSAEQLKIKSAARTIRSVEQAFQDCNDEKTQLYNADIPDEELNDDDDE